MPDHAPARRSHRKTLAYVADAANDIVLGTGIDDTAAMADAVARAPIILACSMVVTGNAYAGDVKACRSSGKRWPS